MSARELVKYLAALVFGFLVGMGVEHHRNAKRIAFLVRGLELTVAALYGEPEPIAAPDRNILKTDREWKNNGVPTP